MKFESFSVYFTHTIFHPFLENWLHSVKYHSYSLSQLNLFLFLNLIISPRSDLLNIIINYISKVHFGQLGHLWS